MMKACNSFSYRLMLNRLSKNSLPDKFKLIYLHNIISFCTQTITPRQYSFTNNSYTPYRLHNVAMRPDQTCTNREHPVLSVIIFTKRYPYFARFKIKSQRPEIGGLWAALRNNLRVSLIHPPHLFSLPNQPHLPSLFFPFSVPLPRIQTLNASQRDAERDAISYRTRSNGHPVAEKTAFHHPANGCISH